MFNRMSNHTNQSIQKGKISLTQFNITVQKSNAITENVRTDIFPALGIGNLHDNFEYNIYACINLCSINLNNLKSLN